jgi:hypothetical protein
MLMALVGLMNPVSADSFKADDKRECTSAYKEAVQEAEESSPDPEERLDEIKAEIKDLQAEARALKKTKKVTLGKMKFKLDKKAPPSGQCSW